MKWGVITVLAPDPLPSDIPTRLTDFTHLVASSISNVHARDNLIASRARIVAASDQTRRLHPALLSRSGLAPALRELARRSPVPVSLDLHGAAPGSGSGLIGLVDRVEALGGKLSIDSPVGRSTMLSIELPLTSPRAVQEGRW